MVKKVLLTSGFTIVFAFALSLTYLIVDRSIQISNIHNRISLSPPSADLFALDSGKFVFPEGRPLVLVLYNSSCEHCQYELAQIKAAINSFNDVELVFLSSEPIHVIKQAALPFQEDRNVNFIKINPEDVYDNFGTVRYPTILIYGSNGKLIKEFKGETKVEAILKYVRQ